MTVCQKCRQPCGIDTEAVEDWVDYGDRLVSRPSIIDYSDCCHSEFREVKP